MCSASNWRAPSSTIRRTCASTATSPTTARASPPALRTNSTVSAAARALRSHTTMRAPCSANRTEASRPIPMPAPVISATFRSSLPGISPSPLGNPRSDSFEVAQQLPVGDRLIESLLLEPPGLEIVLDHLRPEGVTGDPGALQLGQGLAQRLRHLGQRAVLVGVAVEHGRRLQLLLPPVQARRDGGREGQVRVGVGAGDAVLHPEAAVLAADPEAARAVVPAPRDSRRRERARLVALVGIDGRRVEVGELARHRHLAGEPLLEQRRARTWALAREEVAAAGGVPQRRGPGE